MSIVNQKEPERDAFYATPCRERGSIAVRVAGSDSTDYANPPRHNEAVMLSVKINLEY